eukprot:Platyproteum_vivax@DN2461_c0_g1_i1.p1
MSVLPMSTYSSRRKTSRRVCKTELGTLKIERLLGKGGNGVAYSAILFRDSKNFENERVCVKFLSPMRRRKALVDLVKTHSILRDTFHPNVVKIIDVNGSEDTLLVIMQLARGPSLSDVLNKNHELFRSTVECAVNRDENEVACGSLGACRRYMKGLLRGLKFLHGLRIAHCDVKLENLRLSSEDLTTANVVLMDLDDCCVCKNYTDYSNPVYREVLQGTLNYIAPEAFYGENTTKRDIWSAGICMYILMDGRYPFSLQETNKQIHYIDVLNKLSKRVDYSKEVWKSNPTALSLVAYMLLTDPTKRPSAVECLAHPFFEKRSGPAQKRRLTMR